MSLIQKQEGVILAGLDIRMRAVLIAADKAFDSIGFPLVVSSGLDGCHSPASLHYYGLAIDFSGKGLTTTQMRSVKQMIEDYCGISFQVFNEVDHIHVEYDVRTI